jgi:shikimate kinase
VAVTGPLVVLVGPPGAGKTTVAVELAARLGVTVRDTDWDVERSSGSTIADLFVYRGEPVFRALEREAVLVALTDHSGVLAVGGGAVMDPIVEQAMAGHPVVFLDVQLPDAARRIGFNRDRPVLLGNPRAQWQQLMERRRPVYQRVAVARVPTDGLGPEAVADAVLAAMPTLAGHDPGPGTGR